MHPLIRYDIARSFDAQGPRDRVTLYEADGPAHTVSLPAGRETPADGTPDATRRAFYSDVNSAARRAILCDAVPLRDVPYAEDIAYARDILAAGYRKAYAPAGLVVHSNDVTVRGYCRRMIEETRGLQDIGEQVPSVSLPGALARAARAAARDALRLLRDPAYPRLATCRWLLVNPAYHCARWLGIWRGSRP